MAPFIDRQPVDHDLLLYLFRQFGKVPVKIRVVDNLPCFYLIQFILLIYNTGIMRYFSSSNPSSSLQSVMISAQMSRLLCPARIIYTPPGCFQSTSGVSTPFSYMDSFSSRYLSGWLSFKSGYRFHSLVHLPFWICLCTLSSFCRHHPTAFQIPPFPVPLTHSALLLLMWR